MSENPHMLLVGYHLEQTLGITVWQDLLSLNAMTPLLGKYPKNLPACVSVCVPKTYTKMFIEDSFIMAQKLEAT